MFNSDVLLMATFNKCMLTIFTEKKDFKKPSLNQIVMDADEVQRQTLDSIVMDDEKECESDTTKPSSDVIEFDDDVDESAEESVEETKSTNCDSNNDLLNPGEVDPLEQESNTDPLVPKSTQLDYSSKEGFIPKNTDMEVMYISNFI